jgi:osmotically-inducible protein OsmY
MRQFAALLILVGLFIVLVGTQFRSTDGDKLAAVARVVRAKIRAAMPPGVSFAAPVDALRKELPNRPEEAVRARLTTDKRLAGIAIAVLATDETVRLRGMVPDEQTRRVVIDLAQQTMGVERVMDELEVPTKR